MGTALEGGEFGESIVRGGGSVGKTGGKCLGKGRVRRFERQHVRMLPLLYF